MTDDQIAEILNRWYEEQAAGSGPDLQGVLDAHPDLADELRERVDALHVLEKVFSPTPVVVGAPPPEIGPYRILQEIGRGGMGIVYEAEQTTMKRRVALKVLTPSITGAARSIQRFKLEARAAGRLQHTNIVPVHDMGQQGDYWFYAMELVDGPSLNRVLEDLRAGGERAADIKTRMSGATQHGSRSAESNGRTWHRTLAAAFAGVAEALEAVHREGIVHRDVKPGNLLLDADGTLKLADFGLAHLEGNVTMTQTGARLGTAAYMSPEQARARRDDVDHRTDVYSLGATLYEALTLKPAVEEGSFDEMCSDIIHKEPVRPRVLDRGIPKDLETILLKAMEKDRSRRYQRAADLAQDLRRFCEGTTIRARRIGSMGRAWRAIKRRKLISSLVAALILIGTTGIVIVWSEAERRRAAEESRSELLQTQRYDAFLARAQSDMASAMARMGNAQLTDFDETILDRTRDLLDQAIALNDDAQEAFLLRDLVGTNVEARLRDLNAAHERGLSERTYRLLRAELVVGPEGAEERNMAESLVPGATPIDLYVEAMFAGRAAHDEEALDLFTQAIDESQPGEITHYLALRYRARLHARKGNYHDALRDLNVLEDLGDHGVAVQIEIASVLKKMGDEVEASSRLARAVQEASSNRDPIGWHELYLACTDLREIGWMNQVSERAVRELEQSATLLADRADCLLDRDDVDGALELSREAVELEPSSAWAQYIRGGVLAEIGQPDDAIAAYQAGLGSRPESAYLWNALGMVQFRNGQTPDAVDSYREAIRLKPDFDAAQNNLYFALSRQRSDVVASTARTPSREHEALSSNEEANALFLQAKDIWIAYSQDAVLRAIRLYERAVQLDPDFARAYAELASARIWRSWQFGFHEDTPRAKEALDRAVGLAPDDVVTRIAQGNYWFRGHRDFQKALEHYRAALQIDPMNAAATRSVGTIQRRLGQWEEAAAQHEKALLLEEDPERGTRFLGIAYHYLRRYADAERNFDRVIERDPKDQNYYGDIVTLYLSWDGNTSRARQVLETARESIGEEREAYLRARLDFFDRDYQSALERLAALPDSITYSLLRAKAYALLNQTDRAREHYNSVRSFLERHGNDRSRVDVADYGRALAGLGLKEEAIERGRHAVDLLPISRDAYNGLRATRNLAEIYAEVGEHELAIQQLEYLLSIPSIISVKRLRMDPTWDVLREHPRFQALLQDGGGDKPLAPDTLLAQLQLRNITLEEARRNYSRMTGLPPSLSTNIETLMLELEMSGLLPRAQQAIQSERWADALEAFLIVTGRVPGDSEAWYWLGWSLYQMEELDESIHAYERSLEIRRSQSNELAVSGTLVALGLALVANGDHERAEPLLEEGLEIRQRVMTPDDWGIYSAMSALGASLTGQGKFERAEWYLLEGYEGMAVPEERLYLRRDALERLVQLYEAWGKPDQAATWRRSLEDAGWQEMPRLLREGTEKYRAGNWAGAATAFEEVVREDPDNDAVWFMLGNALRELGDDKEASEAEQENADMPERWKAWETHRTAGVYALLGRTELAFLWLNKAVDAGWKDTTHMRSCPDLGSIRDDPQFRAIIERIEGPGTRGRRP